jgi:tetratricopeptide (TPR) repeat protein
MVAVTGARALQLHQLSLQAFDAALPHVQNSGAEIVHANRASSLVDLGRLQEAEAAAETALDCRGLPGALVSFARHTLGRAAEAAGDLAYADQGISAAQRHYLRAGEAYKAAVAAAMAMDAGGATAGSGSGSSGGTDEVSASAFVRVQLKAAPPGTFLFGVRAGAGGSGGLCVRALQPGATMGLADRRTLHARGDGSFEGIPIHPP